MSARLYLDKTSPQPSSRLSVEALSVLDAYLDELIKEEQLSHNAQVLIRRIAPPLCLLANSVEDLFRSLDHPAHGVLNTIVKIAKLSGEGFVPGDALYQTVLESINTLKSQNYSSFDALVRVKADLKHVLKLAKIRAPAAARESADYAGEISAAKVIASLMVLGHARRFETSDEMIYFCLTQWFELIVVTVLQTGQESRTVKELDRLTFTLFYLNSGRAETKHEVFLSYLLPKLDELTRTLAPTCMGHEVDFGLLRQNLSPFLETN